MTWVMKSSAGFAVPRFPFWRGLLEQVDVVPNDPRIASGAFLDGSKDTLARLGERCRDGSRRSVVGGDREDLGLAHGFNHGFDVFGREQATVHGAGHE